MVWLNAVVSALKSVVVPYFVLLSQRTLYAPEPAQQYVTVDDLRAKHRRVVHIIQAERRIWLAPRMLLVRFIALCFQ